MQNPDSSSNDFYIISDDFRLLDYNENVKKRYGEVKRGDFCYKAKMNRDTPCPHCPVAENSKQDSMRFFDSVCGEWMQAVFSKLDSGSYAVVCRPVREDEKDSSEGSKASGNTVSEELQQAFRMNQILLHVMPPDFVACAIVNLMDGTQVRLLRQEDGIKEAEVPYLWDDFLKEVVNAHMTEPEQIVQMQENLKLCMLQKKKPGEVMHFNYYTTYQSVDETPKPVSTTLAFFEQDNLLYMTIFTTENMQIAYEKKLSIEVEKLRRQEEKQRAALEGAMIEALKANTAKSNFLSRMSHDIRTPLNGIIGLLKIDEDHFENQELVRENHKKMQVSANHLLSLINDVLQMSKIEGGNVTLAHEPVSLVELSGEIVTIIKERALEMGIEWNYAGGECDVLDTWVYASPVHLRQIFLNIYGNCIKYNHPGGKITTRVELLEKEGGLCTYQWKIADTGRGMSQRFLQHIFEPFAQEKNDARSVYQGTGLGMAIVKGLLDQMGGSISVTSEEGAGSEFVITIPFEIAPVPEMAPKASPSQKAGIEGLHLMLVEDNELNAEIAQMLLTDQGADVTVATNGKEAVDLFMKTPEGTFDAILMDIMMPVMDGFIATHIIRALKRKDAKTMPIIAMTANAFKEDEKKCLAAGMNAHLTKPLVMQKVVEVIAAYTGSSKNSGES